MRILALNCGSSSIKYRLFDAQRDFRVLAKGTAERIGQESSFIRQAVEGREEQRIETSLPDYRAAMRALHQALVESRAGSGGDIGKVEGVGHRIVHGGERLKEPVIIDESVMEQIREAARFAPLHSQPNIIGIEVSRELLSDVPHVAVFDTAVHQTLEPKAFLYGLPIEYYEKHGIRKYGFHGINHGYVAGEAARILARPLEELKIITCHLGSGCSVTAFERGRSIDTSMGLTPLEGLVMGTRCGDMDPAVVLYLMDTLGMRPAQVSDVLNKESGLLGLCGHNDMRDIVAAAEKGDKRAQAAIEVFVYRVQKYIGAYAAALNGVDVIVFTGGIGENEAYIRERVTRNLSYLGARTDRRRNANKDTVFSSDDSDVRLLNIPANEEKVIAWQTYSILTKDKEYIVTADARKKY